MYTYIKPPLCSSIHQWTCPSYCKIMLLWIQGSLQCTAFISFSYTLRSGNAGSHGSCFKFSTSEVIIGTCVLSCFSRVRVCVTPWTVALQAPLSMGYCRQESWSGLPCPPPGALPSPGMEPATLTSPALAGGIFTSRATSARLLVGEDILLPFCRLVLLIPCSILFLCFDAFWYLHGLLYHVPWYN